MTENQICIDFVAALTLLEQLKQTNGIFLHVPNEISGNKNKIFGFTLRRMGKVNGAPDYIFLSNTMCGCIEFKSEKGKLSESQKLFKDKCHSLDIKYEVARSCDEGLEILRQWGFIKPTA